MNAPLDAMFAATDGTDRVVSGGGADAFVFDSSVTSAWARLEVWDTVNNKIGLRVGTQSGSSFLIEDWATVSDTAHVDFANGTVVAANDLRALLVGMPTGTNLTIFSS